MAARSKMLTPRFTQLVTSLPASVPFVGPEQQERNRGGKFLARLGANESRFGPSPRAIAAMSEASGAMWMYGEPTSHDLRQALAAQHGVGAENIMIGEGIDGLLGYLVRLLVEPNDSVVTSDGAYPTFNYHVNGFGGVLHKVPYTKDDKEDPLALFAKARETAAKIVYLANPDNPMGTWHKGEDIVRAVDTALPDGTLLLLDEAYVECAPPGTAAPVSADDPRLIRMRTFSKVHGLAGARIGYCIGAPPLIDAFNKIRHHFGMNRAAQLGALASLKDPEWLAHVTREIDRSRVRLAAIARENGLEAVPSATNFVAIDCGKDGAFASKVLEGLITRRIFVRMPFCAPQNRCIRVSCGTTEDMDHFADALPRALAEARAA
jgi:histidinol-phosphate aminotransferase